MRPRISIRGSVRPSVHNAFVSNRRKRVISALRWRECRGEGEAERWDEGGERGGDEGCGEEGDEEGGTHLRLYFEK